MEGRLIGWIIIIVGLYYISVGMLCLFIPNYIKNWINKQSVVSLRLIGISIIVTGGLIIAQLLAFGKLFHLLITLAKP